MASEPVTDRPVMPDGYGVPETDEGVLPWSWAVEKLEPALNYWFSTTRPDGRPHAMPAWAAWVDGQLYFEGSPETRRARNVTNNPAIAVHLEDGTEVVIIEGEAHAVGKPSSELAQKLSEIFTAKYGSGPYEYKPEPTQWDAGGLWAIDVKRAFGWTKFPDDVTRWRFA